MIKFAIAEIKNINRNFTIFAQLAILNKQKKVIQALIKTHTNRKIENTFDDFVVKKKLSLIIFLQYDLNLIFLNSSC